jgi:hypothetical protein
MRPPVRNSPRFNLCIHFHGEILRHPRSNAEIRTEESAHSMVDVDMRWRAIFV